MPDGSLEVVAGATFWSAIEAIAITGGIGFIALCVGVAVYCIMREDNGRPVIPWGPRMRVEKAKAGLELDAIEIKRIALEHQRTRVLDAIEKDDHDAVMQLGLPKGD